LNQSEAKRIIEKLRKENEQWLRATKQASMDGIFSIIERVRVEKKKDFILELIQNADDCNSSEISFDIIPSRVIIQNNGDAFTSDPDPTKDSVFAICKLGRTTKASGKIGFMGFGFRAVFEVSRKPEIYSDGFSFYFDEDMIVPHWIETIPQDIKTRIDMMKGKGSVFVLPDLTNEMSRDVKEAIENLSPVLLLYLQKLERIRIEEQLLQISLGPCLYSFWVSGGEQRFLWKKYSTPPLLIPSGLREYLRKDRNLDKIGKEPKECEQISITFEITPEGRIVNQQNGGLFAFLPLVDEKYTRFAFSIQADFSVDAGRRRLSEPEGSWNQWILANVHNCIPLVLNDYKSQQEIRTEFYKILPLTDPERPQYLNVAKQKIDECIKRQESILIKIRKTKKNPDGKTWVKPKHAVIAPLEVQSLFDTKDLKHFFGLRKSYVDNSIDDDGMKYLKEIVEDKLDFDQIVRFFEDHQWISDRKIKRKKHPEKWVGDLIIYFATELEKKLEGKSWWNWDYKNEKRKFIEELLDVKFLLTEGGELNEPRKMLLPSHKGIDISEQIRKDRDIVCRRLVRYLETKRIKSEAEKGRREKGISLLKDLSQELSPEAIVDEIINPAFRGDNWKDLSDPTLIRYTNFVMEHETCWERAKIKLRADARKMRVYKDPDELYLGSKYGNEFDLDTLYKGYEDGKFVSLEYIRDFIGSKKKRGKQLRNSWRKFLTRIGIKTIPKIQEHTKEHVSRKELEEELAYPQDKIMDTYWTYSYPGYAKKDFDFYDDLKAILANCLSEKIEDSRERLNILMRIFDRRWNYYSKYIEAQYGWHMDGQWGRKYERLGPSSFAKFLRDSEWVPTKDGRHLKPCTVALNELKGVVKAPILAYRITNREFRNFLEGLGLQMRPTVEGVMALLRALVDQEDKKVARFLEIYKYLSQHDNQKEKIKSECGNFPCIFVPGQKKKYWKISEIFWDSGGSFLEWKTDIKETYPHLKDFFLDVLGVKLKPTHKDYMEFLQYYLWEKEILSDDERDAYDKVLHHLAYIVTTPELKNSDSWANLKKEFKILCENNHWARIDEEIYYKDNDELYELFSEHTDMLFAYVPKNMEIKQLFSELGIRSLSEKYEERCHVTGEQTAPEGKYKRFEDEIRRICRYIALFVQEKSPQKFDRLSDEDAFRRLSKTKLRFVENLEVEGIADEYKIPLGERLAFYSLRGPENCLYLKDHLKDNETSCFEHIGIALSNAFGRVESLEFFVPYIAGREKQQIIQSMQNYGISVKEEIKLVETLFEEREIFGAPPERPPAVEQPIDGYPTETPSSQIAAPPPEEPSVEPPSSKEQSGIEPTPKSPPQRPPEIETPPEAPPRKPMTVVTERQIRDSRMADWVKASYSYHCQVCLSKEKPEILTYYKSYAGREPNRRSIMEAHHIKEVARDQGHDHIGNYLSLCRHHHTLLHRLNLSLDDLKNSLTGVIEKEIIWPNGEITEWKIVKLGNEFVEENQPIQIILNQAHLEKLQEYINYVYFQ